MKLSIHEMLREMESRERGERRDLCRLRTVLSLGGFYAESPGCTSDPAVVVRGFGDRQAKRMRN